MRVDRIQTLCCCAAAVVLLLATEGRANNVVWAAPNSGWFHDDINWIGGAGTPGPGDTVGFVIPGAFDVWWNAVTGDRTTQSLSVTDCDVTFRVSDGSHNWAIADPSLTADVLLDGATFTLGNAVDTGRLTVEVNRLLRVWNGGALNVVSGARLDTFSTQLEYGTMRVTNGGTVSDVNGDVGMVSGKIAGVTVDGGKLDVDVWRPSTWANSYVLVVGGVGDGTLAITGGGLVSCEYGSVANDNGSIGEVAVEGGVLNGSLWTPSTWISTQSLTVGDFGHGTLSVTDGGRVDSGRSYVGTVSVNTGVATIAGTAPDGTPSTWASSDTMTIGSQGAGTLLISAGGYVSNTDGIVGEFDLGVGSVTVDGGVLDAGQWRPSTWANASSLVVGQFGQGTLTIANGGAVVDTNGYVGVGEYGGVGQVTVAGTSPDGTPATWTNTGSLTIGREMPDWGFTGRVVVGEGGKIVVGQTLRLLSDGSMSVAGGNICFGTPKPLFFDGGTLNFYAGTVMFDCDVSIGGGQSHVTHDALFGASPVIPTGKTLEVVGKATLLTPLTLDGGTLSAGSLVNWAFLQFNTGTLRLTASDLSVGNGGALGATIDLFAGQHIDVTQRSVIDADGLVVIGDGASLGAGELVNLGEIELTGRNARLRGGALINEGLIAGYGRVDSALDNADGEVRVGAGQRMVFTAASNNNAGVIVVAEMGQFECFGQLDNVAGGRIHASGGVTLNVAGGLFNAGVVNFDGGESRVYGAVEIAADPTNPGRVSVGGQGRAVFFDDVVQNGLVVVGAGSTTAFYGNVTGAGGYLGDGTTEFYGTFQPGNSPAAVSFEGSVSLNAATRLVMELGGNEPGAEYDVLDVDDTLSLGGTLDVRLLPGFAPTGGDTFDILNWSTLAGTFDEMLLPSLGGSWQWDTNELYVSGQLSVVSVILIPGDANRDGAVDAEDATILADHWGQTVGGWEDGDFNDDGRVTAADASILAANWGSHVAEESGTAVPEPLGMVMLAQALSLLAARRRERK